MTIEKEMAIHIPNQVWDRIEDQITNQVWDQVNKQVGDQILDYILSLNNRNQIRFHTRHHILSLNKR